MLAQLYIKNYALIDELDVNFDQGFTIITGETGAGKSILLGGLSLVLGKRVDFSNIKDSSKKSIIECTFSLKDYDLTPFFDCYDLEYEPETIIRREVLPSGKSRAFINDSPVTLAVLEALGQQLIDIHAQHETLSLADDAFQFQIIDALAQTHDLLNNYKDTLADYKENQKKLESLQNQQQQSKKDYDYNSFLLQEIEEAQVLNLDLKTLESQYETLSNVDYIQSELQFAQQILSHEDVGVSTQLNELKQRFNKLKDVSSECTALFERILSTQIELEDIFTEIEHHQNILEANPQLLFETENQLKKINDLFGKHNVQTIEELNFVFEELSKKVKHLTSLDAQLESVNNLLLKNIKKLNKISSTLSAKRNCVLIDLQDELHLLLADLGMPNAVFKIELQPCSDFLFNGKDVLKFLLKANKGGQFLPLNKGASGGELSRIMLAVKYILSKHQQLPTIMFDEIDTGVSGEISNKMASIMKDMSQYMQVFTITHLPQIAAKGTHHFKVFKQDFGTTTTTQLAKLNSDERLEEIAQMLGGKEITETAKQHAQQLLN
ncbi:DNA recombination protein RecN [Formosa sp. Hel3_A1_48]|uniref:DNA repair protein RecN n=1 Tax=Formosa sp. Hel3_A1_48 TaxID=1336795 RepID=UPI00084E10B6|nr:DNA repair protein RecN [Formosa sp. Hel3_A1_48]AOR25489.1 DNA recombination protein RecN [Formosa sp. Hel3_A1_48]